MNKIVVLGGGFAGVEAAIKLRKKGHQVILVSDRDYLFIYPISIWIPTGKKTFNDVKIDLGQLSRKHGFELIIDKAVSIDAENNTVILEHNKLTYSYLIIALGMGKLKAPGIEHTHSICGKPDESVIIQKELEKIIERGEGSVAVGFGGNPKDPTATEVRGGPAFELLFNISHHLKSMNLRDKIQLTFFAPMKEPGKRMGEKPFREMDNFFKRYHIKQVTGKKIKRFDANGVLFDDDSRLEADLTIFIAAGDGHPVLKQSPNIPLNASGFVQINELCRLEGHKNIYAVGDVAAIEGPVWAAKQGHIAEVMASTAAYNIHNEIKQIGKRKSYWEHLNIICVMDTGDGAAFIKRTRTSEMLLPLPIVGHWLKKGWGWYYKNSKLGRIPRFPGM